MTFFHYVSLTFLTLDLLFIITENLSRKNSTKLTQSSTYNNNIASRANDGDLKTKETSCAHTNLNHSIAWFQVDLGKSYNIDRVIIYYRNEGMYHGIAHPNKPLV